MSLKAEQFFDLAGCPCPNDLQMVSYPWDILAEIPRLIREIVNKNPGKYKEIAPEVWVGKGTNIADSATLLGPILIGENCSILPNAYIRQNVLAGNDVIIGHCTEVKQALLFDEVHLPHFNYVGDSILGKGAHLGAGAIISNFKSTKKPVKVHLDGAVLDTGLSKFGAIIGDGVEVGCNAVINPGTLIGSKTIIYPLSLVRGSIPKDAIYKDSNNIVPYKN